MSFPSPFYVLLKGGSYLTVVGALSETFENILNYDQANYRDQLPPIPAVSAASVFDTNVPGTSADLQGSGDAAVTATAVVAGTFYKATVDATSPMIKDDNWTHTAPRFEQHQRTMIRWWDIANYVPGVAGSFSATTAPNSAVLTLAAGSTTDGLFNGQGITGTNIQAGTTIRAIISSTTLMLSKVATGAGTNVMTVAAGTGGNLVGECWADRFIGWSSKPPGR